MRLRGAAGPPGKGLWLLVGRVFWGALGTPLTGRDSARTAGGAGGPQLPATEGRCGWTRQALEGSAARGGPCLSAQGSTREAASSGSIWGLGGVGPLTWGPGN